MIDIETADDSDSGYVTTVAPEVIIKREAPKSILLLDYRYEIIRSHGLDQEDKESHLLDLFANYEHSPGRWISSLYATSQLTNTDIDGIQNIDPEIGTDNTKELHTVEVDTEVTDKLSDTVRYRSRLNADYADVEDEGNSRGYGLSLGLNNEDSPDQFTWRAGLKSQVAEDDEFEDRVDTLDVLMDNRFNQRWSSFVKFTHTETDETDLDEDSALIGVTWQANPRTSFLLGVGKRENDDMGDEDTYEFNATHRRQNMILAANYSEEITTRRADTLAQVRNDDGELIQGTTQEISAEPILQKRGAITLTVNGRYSQIVTSIFNTKRLDRPDNAVDEETNGLRFRYLRNLNARNSISMGLLAQETEAQEENELLDVEFNFIRVASANQTWIFKLGWAEQESTDAANEYESSLFSVQYIVTF